jgi:hypothetical protein
MEQAIHEEGNHWFLSFFKRELLCGIFLVSHSGLVHIPLMKLKKTRHKDHRDHFKLSDRIRRGFRSLTGDSSPGAGVQMQVPHRKGRPSPRLGGGGCGCLGLETYEDTRQ